MILKWGPMQQAVLCTSTVRLARFLPDAFHGFTPLYRFDGCFILNGMRTSLHFLKCT